MSSAWKLVCLCLNDDKVLFSIGVQRLLKLQKEIIAPWRSDRLICLGGYRHYVGEPESVKAFARATFATNEDDHNSFYSYVCENSSGMMWRGWDRVLTERKVHPAMVQIQALSRGQN